MPNRSTLTIPAPCHESWAAMTPAVQGRHCAACSKVVVDFTQKTDAEILTLLGRLSQPCGRFTVSQLNRPLLVPPGSAPRWQTWLAAAATVLGLREAAALETRAQHPMQPERVITMGIVAAPHRVLLPPVEASPFVVRGRVTANDTSEGLPGVTVLVQGTTIGVSTNADGTFELQIPALMAHPTLRFSSIGYITEERILEPAALQKVFINLELDAQTMGEMVVVTGGLAYRQPWPWHPRAAWYWLPNAFRW